MLLVDRKAVRSVANLDAAHPPGITIPEPLTLPIAGGTCGIGRPAVVTRTAIIAVLRCNRAADDGAADQSGRNARGHAALRMSRSRRRQGRNSQGGSGRDGHQCSLHGFTSFMKALDRESGLPADKVSYFA